MAGLTEWAKPKKKGKRSGKKIGFIITGCTGGAAALLFGTFKANVPPGSVLLSKFAQPTVDDVDMMQPMTAVVERTDVEQLFNTTGSVISNESDIFNAREAGGGTTTGYVVKDVFVKVGDEVQAGDPLFTIDTSEAEYDIAMKQQQLEMQNEQNAMAEASAQRDLEITLATNQIDAAAEQRALESAADTTNHALLGTLNSEQYTVYLRQKAADAKTAADTAAAALTAYQSTYNEKKSLADAAALKAQTNPDDKDALNANAEAQQALTNAAAQLSSLQEAATNTKAAYDTAQSEYESALTNGSSQDGTIQSAYEAQLSAVDSSQKGTMSREQAEQAARDNLRKTQLSNEQALMETQNDIKQSQEKLAKNTVTTDVSGVVTSVNVLPGQNYTGTSAVIVQDVSTMKASVDVDEAQIADIAVGTKVRVTTDASGDTPLDGEVCFVSPVPVGTDESSADPGQQTSSSASTHKRASYRVDIQLDGDTSRLRIGMTAKITFVLKSEPDTLAVPKTCVMTDDTGSYITKVAGDGSDLYNTETIPVTVTAEGDYYAAVSGDGLNEGDIIIDNGDGSMSAGDGSTDAGASGDMLGGVY